MLQLLTLILAVTVPLQARIYNNPVLGEGDFADPGVIKVDSTYYIVTTKNESTTKKFPIYASDDLQSWQLQGHVFDETNIPQWASENNPFSSPRIYKIGTNYIAYFTAHERKRDRMSIGVAIAPNLAGPYTVTDRPLVSEINGNDKDPSIIYENENIYLIWVNNNVVKGRKLIANGLNFYATHSTELIRGSSAKTIIGGPWHTQRGALHYLIYSEEEYSNQTLRVVSSAYPLGPYNPENITLYNATDAFIGVGHITLVEDLDKTSELIFYDGYRKNQVGSGSPKAIIVSSVSWTDHSLVPETTTTTTQPPPTTSNRYNGRRRYDYYE